MKRAHKRQPTYTARDTQLTPDPKGYRGSVLAITIHNMFSIRAGYPGIGKKDAIEGLSFGVGVKYPIMNSNNKLSVDYTSSDFGPLGIVQRVSLGFNY